MFEFIGFIVGLALAVLFVVGGHLIWRFIFEFTPWAFKEAPPLIIIYVLMFIGSILGLTEIGTRILKAVKP